MPHIIVELAQGACPESSYSELVSAVHQAVADSGLFENSNIKTRLHPVRHFQLAAQYKAFVAVQCRIHKGRDVAQKCLLGESLLRAVQQFVLAETVITIEVVEMERDSYIKGVGKALI